MPDKLYKLIILDKQKGNFDEQITILKKKFLPDDLPTLSEDGGGVRETLNKVVFDRLIKMGICETPEQHEIRTKNEEIHIEQENILAEKEKLRVENEKTGLIIKTKKIQEKRAAMPFSNLYYYTDTGAIIFRRTDIARYFIDKYNALISSKNRYMYIYDNIEGIYKIDYKGDAVRTELNNMFGDIIDIREQNEIINKIFHYPGFQHDELEGFWMDPRYICCNNGIYNIETKELVDHSPEYYFLSKLSVNYVEDAMCPKLDKLMLNIFDEDQILQEYEWIGYCLTPGNRYKLISVYIGSTDSGRTTYFNVINKMIGNHNIIPIEPQDLSKEFYIINLHGKMLSICADVGTHKITGFNKIKLIVGNDLILGNEKGKPMIPFVNSAKFMWAANRMPATDDTTTASYNRFRKVDCVRTIPDDNQKEFIFDDHVTDEELSGLFNHALEGLQMLDKRGGFVLPSITDRMNDLEIASNGIFMWAEDCLQFTRGWDNKIFGCDLITSYLNWCNKEGVKIPIDANQFIIDFKKSFHKSFLNYGTISIKGVAKRGVRGVKWNIDHIQQLVNDIEDEYDDVFDD